MEKWRVGLVILVETRSYLRIFQKNYLELVKNYFKLGKPVLGRFGQLLGLDRLV